MIIYGETHKITGRRGILNYLNEKYLDFDENVTEINLNRY